MTQTFTKMYRKMLLFPSLTFCYDWLLMMKNANNLGEWRKGKNHSWAEEWPESILHPPHPGRFIAVLGTNAVGEEQGERGSSNRRHFATLAENTDEKQACSWDQCFSWWMCQHCCMTPFAPWRCENSAVRFPQPKDEWKEISWEGIWFGEIQLIQMNTDDVHIPNDGTIWKAIIC